MSDTCTIGPSAVTGERCGKPAVSSFVTRHGRFFECAEHDTSGIQAPSPIKAGAGVIVTHVGVEKIGTVIKSTETFVWVEVPCGGCRYKVIKVRREEVRA